MASAGMPMTQDLLLRAVPEEKQQDGYMSAPEEEQQVMNADRVDHAASYMEMTVPLLHEAMPARTLLTDMSRPRKPQVRTLILPVQDHTLRRYP